MLNFFLVFVIFRSLSSYTADFENRKERSILSDAVYWPGRIIPYIIGPGVTEVQKQNIKLAIDEYHKLTCLKFRQFTKPTLNQPLLWFNSSNGCGSLVGMQPEGQAIGVYYCGPGGIIHEIMHALGFIHENTRPDRDQHIKILRENQAKVTEGEDYFEIQSIKTPSLPYDCLSIMHQSNNANAKEGKITMEPFDKKACFDRYGNSLINGSYSFSLCDLAKINHIYKCPGHEVFRKRDCKVGKNYKRILPEYPDEKAFCSNKVFQQKLCDKEPGKYSVFCRKSCQNNNAFCSNTDDEKLNSQICNRIPKDYKNFEAGFKCNEVQEKYCPVSCFSC